MKKSAEQDKTKPARNKNRKKYKRKKNAKQNAKRTIEKGLLSGTAAEECLVGHQNRPPAATTVSTGANFPRRTVPNLPRMKNAQNIWAKTYQNIVKWHSQHQLNYWKQYALQLREENERLKRRLAVQDSEDEDEEVREAQQSRHRQDLDAPEDEDDEETLDEEFIAFMEVSARHRLERRRLKNESVH